MKRKIIGILVFILVSQFSQAILVRFPNLTGVVGDTLTVPLYVDDDLTGNNVLSFQFDIGYSSSNVELLRVDTVGTISSKFKALTGKDNLNHFSIVGAGTSPLTGKGVLLNLKLVLLSSGTYLQFLNGTASNYLNEGSPALTFTTGYISISAKPVIYVSPATAVLNVGEVQQFNASGGTGPYIWSLSDNTIASIAPDGKLTALKNGLVKVIAGDSKSYKGESGYIDCRSFSVTCRDTGFYQNNYIEIPLTLKNFDATPLFAGKFVITFNQNVISIDSVISSNSILAGKATVEYLKQSGKIIITFAAANGITASGALFKLRFKIADVQYGASYISIDEATLNETYTPKIRNGYFSISPLPAVYINPGSAEMFSGDSKQFSVSGGTAPYTWTVDNPTLASTTATGNLTAISGGTVKLQVRDLYGSNTSCNVTIYDTWVNVRDSAAVVTQRMLTIPIDMGNLPSGKGIIALSGKASSYFSKIDSIRVMNADAKTSNWQLANKTMKNQANFAMSGTVPITSSGKIGLIRIYFNSSIAVNDAFYMECNELLLNEGNPSVKVKSGYISIKSIISGLNDPKLKSGVLVYPIPAINQLFVKLPSGVGLTGVSVLDLSGKILLANSLKDFSDQEYVLSIEFLKKGFYLLKLENNQNTEMLKFVKE